MDNWGKNGKKVLADGNPDSIFVWALQCRLIELCIPKLKMILSVPVIVQPVINMLG